MTQTAVITVMIADDHDILRRGIAHVVQSYPSLELVAQATRLAEAPYLCRQTRPDILLIEPITRGDGIEIIRAVHRDCPETRVIVLSDVCDEHTVQAAIQAGVTSYLLKHVSSDELVNAIYDAYVGKSTLAREAAQALVNASQRPSASSFNLTRRELEVLELMIHGLKNTEIADTLTVSRSTVKKHVSSILNKLNTSSRTEAVAVAMQNRIVPL